ncbi:hypothetical protein P2G88_17380 [Aliiglaciecola sp. CAU 1673]|uniref:hypothetical protein n=1 Tax=Aliiglaciecola sp. CAU 1673 TaxID=3032595 RepID=UPI0023DC429C|nr:hypothetical protein [Aliiglaciecola sp. CAU 1673]MDF2180030.1 hypothetical protein [Aliiglaciecola sp. CAU 1673]
MKQKLLKYGTLVLVVYLMLKPETMAMALMIDAVGIELFVLLVGLQFSSALQYAYVVWFKPIALPVSRWLVQRDSY